MTDTKKARFDTAMSKQAIKIGIGRSSIPIQDNTTAALKGQIKISDFLSTGRGEARNMGTLVSMLGLDRRTVRTLIEAERRQGVPILSDSVNGYFLPGCPDDVKCFVFSMRHRANEILMTAAAVEAGPRTGAAHGATESGTELHG